MIAGYTLIPDDGRGLENKMASASGKYATRADEPTKSVVVQSAPCFACLDVLACLLAQPRACFCLSALLPVSLSVHLLR